MSFHSSNKVKKCTKKAIKYTDCLITQLNIQGMQKKKPSNREGIVQILVDHYGREVLSTREKRQTDKVLLCIYYPNII